MIEKENIDPTHSIDSVLPEYLIKLPFKDNELIDEDNVTCVFCIRSGPWAPDILKCVGIDYFDKINNDILMNKNYGQYIPEIVYVFKGNHLKLKINAED